MSEPPRPAAVPEALEHELKFAPGELYLAAKLDASVDRKRWSVWSKGASAALSAIALRKATVDWSVTRSRALRFPNPEIAGISPEVFLESVVPLLSDKAAESRHLWGWWSLLDLKELAYGALEAKPQPVRPGSLKAPASLPDNAVIIALSPGDGERTEIYLVERSAFATLGADLTAIPTIRIAMAKADGSETVGRATPPLLRVYDQSHKPREHLAAMSAWGGGHHLGISTAYCITGAYDGKPNVVALLPWMASFELDDTPHVFSEVTSLTLGFTARREEIGEATQVRAVLGERHPSLGSSYAARNR